MQEKSNAAPQPGTAAALDFLRHWPEPWVLTAIEPDTRRIETRCFDGTSEAAAAAWIDGCQGRRNVYFSVNLPRPDHRPSKKMEKAEIGAVVALHVDVDPADPPEGCADVAAHYERERTEILARIEAHPRRPSLLIDSGNGYQALWLLVEPYKIENVQHGVDQIEARNKRLERTLGGDHCHNIDRILRLPGTLNIPNAKKRDKGRVVTLAKLVWCKTRYYGLHEFEPWVDPDAKPSSEGEARSNDGERDPEERLRPGKKPRPIARRLAAIMRDGLVADTKGTYKGDRSLALFAVNCALVRANQSIGFITALNLDKANKLSEHVYDQSDPTKYARRQAERAFAAVLAAQKPLLARGNIDKACHVNEDGSYWQEVKPRRDVHIEHFWAYSQNESYIFTPDASMWPKKRVAAMVSDVGLFASDGAPVTRDTDEGPRQIKLPGLPFIDSFRAVQQMTWWPAEPQIIRERLAFDGGWLPHAGAKVFNIYHPPEGGGDAREGERHLDLVRELFATGDDAERIVRYLAHCCQHPAVKINHALLLGGEQGIGKDTVGAGMRGAIGEWNYKPVSPAAAMEKFNAQIRSVMLHISESHEGTESARFDRYAFYEWLKEITAEPPAMLFVNEKHMPKFWIKKPTGVVITTNHPLNSTYLPPDDRRVDVCWSPRLQGWKGQGFFDAHFAWIDAGGGRHIAAALGRVDLSGFNPHATPFHSEAWHAIVQTARPVQEVEMNDTLDWLGVPMIVTVALLREACTITEQHRFAEWLADEKNYSKIPMRFHDNGYEVLSNPDRKDGRWKIDAKPQTAYARKNASSTERRAAIDELIARGTLGIMGKIRQAREAAEKAAQQGDEWYNLPPRE